MNRAKVGDVFGRNTVLEVHGRKAVVKCSCGSPARATSISNLLSGGPNQSCGCWRKERMLTKNPNPEKIGDGSRAYASWVSMMRRCGLTQTGGRAAPTKDTRRYLEKGITVHPAWIHYAQFLQDMGPCPPGYSLDRFPNRSGSYEPGNCRWATINEQNRNRDFCVELAFEGKTQTLTEWAREVNISRHVLERRLKEGWLIALALTFPHERRGC